MDNLWLKNFLKRLRLNESMISTLLGGVVVVVVAVLVYNYFSGINQPAPEAAKTEATALVEENGQMVPDNLPIKHTVAAGEDLWHISQKYFESGYNWVDIAKANNLTNANIITAGQELAIPRVGVKAPAQEPTVAGTQTETLEGSDYTVQKGDSLWKISVRAYNDGYAWTKIWEANKELIPAPNVIETGTVLQLPR